MVKRLFEVFGLAVMGVGLYFVFSEHTKNNACNVSGANSVSVGMSPSCQHVVYAYFGGFVLVAAGALVAVFGLLATRKAAKKPLANTPSIASQYQWVDPKTGRSA
jgi:hypothetical protein